jgi:hypothetical protein
MRVAALIIGLLDAVLWAVIAVGMFLSLSDPATLGLDTLAGWLVTGLFLITGAPALLLVWRNTKPGLALALAIAFPAAFAILFVGAMVAFA